MNTVTVFIILAYIIPNIGTAATVVSMLGLMALLAIVLMAGISFGDKDLTRRFGEEPAYPVLLKQLKWLVPMLTISWAFALVIPDKETFYLIAASELGEEVVKSPEAQELYEEVKKVLKSYSKIESK